MKLSIHTSQHQSPGSTSLALGIAYTDGLLNEAEISSACELAIHAFKRSISESVVRNCGTQRVREIRTSQATPERDTLDKILEQVLRQGSHLSTV